MKTQSGPVRSYSKVKPVNQKEIEEDKFDELMLLKTSFNQESTMSSDSGQMQPTSESNTHTEDGERKDHFIPASCPPRKRNVRPKEMAELYKATQKLCIVSSALANDNALSTSGSGTTQPRTNGNKSVFTRSSKGLIDVTNIHTRSKTAKPVGKSLSNKMNRFGHITPSKKPVKSPRLNTCRYVGVLAKQQQMESSQETSDGEELASGESKNLTEQSLESESLEQNVTKSSAVDSMDIDDSECWITLTGSSSSNISSWKTTDKISSKQNITENLLPGETNIWVTATSGLDDPESSTELPRRAAPADIDMGIQGVRSPVKMMPEIDLIHSPQEKSFDKLDDDEDKDICEVSEVASKRRQNSTLLDRKIATSIEEFTTFAFSPIEYPKEEPEAEIPVPAVEDEIQIPVEDDNTVQDIQEITPPRRTTASSPRAPSKSHKFGKDLKKGKLQPKSPKVIFDSIEQFDTPEEQDDGRLPNLPLSDISRASDVECDTILMEDSFVTIGKNATKSKSGKQSSDEEPKSVRFLLHKSGMEEIMPSVVHRHSSPVNIPELSPSCSILKKPKQGIFTRKKTSTPMKNLSQSLSFDLSSVRPEPYGDSELRFNDTSREIDSREILGFSYDSIASPTLCNEAEDLFHEPMDILESDQRKYRNSPSPKAAQVFLQDGRKNRKHSETCRPRPKKRSRSCSPIPAVKRTTSEKINYPTCIIETLPVYPRMCDSIYIYTEELTQKYRKYISSVPLDVLEIL